MLIVEGYVCFPGVAGSFASTSHHSAEPGASNGPAELCPMRQLCPQDKEILSGKIPQYISSRDLDKAGGKSPFPLPALPAHRVSLHSP